MPVEIREIVFRAVVVEKESKREVERPRQDRSPDQRLIEECVRQVLQTLKRNEER